MAVRNSHVRQSTKEVYATLDGKKYSLTAENWNVNMNKVRYAAKKLEQGKLSIPVDAQVYYTITHLQVTEEGKVIA